MLIGRLEFRDAEPTLPAYMVVVPLVRFVFVISVSKILNSLIYFT